MIYRLLVYLKAFVQSYSLRDQGATSVEYAIMASLIAMVIIGAVASIGLAVSGKFDLVLPGLG
jgi:Flp pilus assembly pilin Flp